MASWRQLHAARNAGIEIGAHTIAGGHELAARFGPITAFAYPSGYHDRAIRRRVSAEGYLGACAVGDKLARLDGDRFAINRLVVRADTSVGALDEMLGAQRVPRFHRGATLSVP